MPVPRYHTNSSSSTKQSSSMLQVDTTSRGGKKQQGLKPTLRMGNSPHRQLHPKSSPSRSSSHHHNIPKSSSPSSFVRKQASAGNSKYSPKLTTHSTDDSSASSGSEQQRETVLDKLRTNLSRFTRSGNRRMMLRTLQNNKSLSAIPVPDIHANLYDPESSEEWQLLEHAVGQTVPINLNGMVIGTVSTGEGGVQQHPELVAREGRKFLQLLRLLCQRLAIGLEQRSDASSTGSNNRTLTAVQLFQHVLQRLAKDSSELTAMDAIRPILATPELSLQVPSYKKTQQPPPTPTVLTLYVADGYAHCTVQHVHQLGLFRAQDAPSRPFCSLTAKVHERVNLTTGQGVKHVSVNVLEDKMLALYG